MSVYIKGMKIPTAGRILIVLPSGRTLEVSANETQNIFREALSVPVPPHGRLIDADALASEMEKQISNQDELMELCKSVGDTKNYFNSSKVQTGMVSFLRALNDSPTIIEAEE